MHPSISVCAHAPPLAKDTARLWWIWPLSSHSSSALLCCRNHSFSTQSVTYIRFVLIPIVQDNKRNRLAAAAAYYTEKSLQTQVGLALPIGAIVAVDWVEVEVEEAAAAAAEETERDCKLIIKLHTHSLVNIYSGLGWLLL